MRTIEVVLTANDERSLDREVEEYKTSYPPLGYDARVRRVSVNEDGCHYAHVERLESCLLYTSPSPRDRTRSRMPSSA